MVKLYVGINHIILVLLDEFIVFTTTKKEKNWEFQRTVKCVQKSQKNEAAIECCAFSPCGNYFGVCFNRNIIIYGTSQWNELSVSPGERKASSLNFFPKSSTILLANKSGCALFYSFDENKLEKIERSLGHNSMLTSALITNDEKFVITGDRDEKIRVTNYPNVYNIERYCLGHRQFVTWLGFLPSDEKILVSSSGDGTIRFWDYMSGTEVAVYNCNEFSVSNTLNTDMRTVIAKVASCKVNSGSVLAVFQYKSSQIRILKVISNLDKTLCVEQINTLKLKCAPWDIMFCNDYLISLLPLKNEPVVIWSAIKNDLEDNHFFKNIERHLIGNFDSILNISQKISDTIPVLFKREVDNLQEYEQRKKARLLKTGRTS